MHQNVIPDQFNSPVAVVDGTDAVATYLMHFAEVPRVPAFGGMRAGSAYDTAGEIV